MPEAEFEKTFADLAHARLRDRAPGLLDYLIGFQLLDKNDDDTHAVGVWGFKIGEEWLYAPVFFLNGQLKGDELLYLKSQDAFVPLKENWINYLLNRRPYVLGETEMQTQSDMGIQQPDFNAFARPPYSGSKYSSSGLHGMLDRLVDSVDSNFKPFLPVVISSPGGEKRASLSHKWHLPNFIRRSSEKVARTLLNTMKKNAAFTDAVLKFYKMEDIIGAAKEAFSKEAKEWPVNHPYINDKVKVIAAGDSKGKTGQMTKVKSTDDESESISEDGTKTRITKKTYDVTVTLKGGGTFTTANPAADLVEYRESDSGDKCCEAKAAADGDKVIKGTAPAVQVLIADRANVLDLDDTMLSDTEKEKLQRDRYLVKDKRGDSDVGKLYHREISKTLQNPVMCCYSNVLMTSGEFQKRLVMLHPKGCERYRNSKRNRSNIIDVSGGKMVMAAPRDIFVDNEGHDAEGWKKAFNALPECSSVTERKKVVFVNEKGEGTTPFLVSRKVSSDGQTMLYGEFDEYPIAAGTVDKLDETLFPRYKGRAFNDSDADGWYGSRHDSISCGSGSESCMVITGKPGNRVTQIGNDYFIPAGFKCIKMSKDMIEPWKRKDLEDPKSWRKQELASQAKVDEMANPQSLVDIEMQLFKSSEMKEIQPVSDGIEWWLRENNEMSRPMSKIAAIRRLVIDYQLREKDALGVLKTAARAGSPKYLVKLAQPSAPAFPEPQMGTDPSLQTAPPVLYPQNDLISANPEPMNNYNTEMDMDATFRAEQAAGQDQKEVLDTSVISGLVKVMDPDTVVDNYIGDLMLGLDRIGRILFMYYWHFDKFKDRYGSQDMPELEDNLKNVFDNMGDLVIFLKQKTIEPDVSDATAEAELEQVL